MVLAFVHQTLLEELATSALMDSSISLIVDLADGKNNLNLFAFYKMF